LECGRPEPVEESKPGTAAHFGVVSFFARKWAAAHFIPRQGHLETDQPPLYQADQSPEPKL
jgi:hypothetical protein